MLCWANSGLPSGHGVTVGTGYPRPGSKRSPAPSPRWPPRQQRTPGRWPPDALAPTADDLPARMRGPTSRARLLARPPPWAGPALDSGKDSEDRRPGRAALIREAGPLNRGVSPLASLKPLTELLSKPEQSHKQLPNLRSRKPSSISEVPASDVPGRRGRAEVPVLWGTPSFTGKSTEAITEIRL